MIANYYFQTEFEERTIQQYADYIYDFFLSIQGIEKNSFERIRSVHSKADKWISINENDIESRVNLAKELLSYFKKGLKTYENILNPTVDTILSMVQVITFRTQIAGVDIFILFNLGMDSPSNISFDVRDANWNFDLYKNLFEIIIYNISPKYAYIIPHNLKRAMNYVDLPSNTYKVGWVNYFSNDLRLDANLKFENQENFHNGFLTMSVADVFDESNLNHIEKAGKMFEFFKTNKIVKDSSFL